MRGSRSGTCRSPPKLRCQPRPKPAGTAGGAATSAVFRPRPRRELAGMRHGGLHPCPRCVTRRRPAPWLTPEASWRTSGRVHVARARRSEGRSLSPGGGRARTHGDVGRSPGSVAGAMRSFHPGRNRGARRPRSPKPPARHPRSRRPRRSAPPRQRGRPGQARGPC